MSLVRTGVLICFSQERETMLRHVRATYTYDEMCCLSNVVNIGPGVRLSINTNMLCDLVPTKVAIHSAPMVHHRANVCSGGLSLGYLTV